MNPLPGLFIMKALSIRVLETTKKHSILAGILVVGFLLRMSGVLWGTPFLGPFEGYYHPDEWNIVQGAIKFPHHVVENLRFVYPTFFHYFLGILTFPLRFPLHARGHLCGRQPLGRSGRGV